MRNCTHSLVRKAADVFPELSESELNMKTDLVIEMINKLLNSFITNYYSNFITIITWNEIAWHVIMIIMTKNY